MSHTPHELPELFPDAVDAIHRLKLSDAHFARLAENHHRLNREIHRAETNVEPTDDLHLEALKKERLALLDEISEMLRKAG